MKKILISLMALCLSASMVFAGGASETSSSKTSSAIDEIGSEKNTEIDGGTNLSLWTFQELHVGFYTTMADTWNKIHPDKPINLTVSTGDSASMHTKMLVALQSGVGAPDICDIEIGHFGTFLNNGYLLPLNDVVEPYEDQVVMSRIKMYGDNMDNWYGIDFHVGASVTYYNMDIMNKAGIDPATIITWDDYYNAGLKILKKTGKPICAVEVSDLFFPQLMLLEKNIQYVDANGNPNINNPSHVEVANFIKKMINAGICIIAPGGGFHTEEWYGFFDKGGVASISMPLWYMGRFTDYMTDLNGKMGLYEIPVWNKGDTRCVLQGGTGTAVTNQTQNASLAKEFLAFAKLSKEGNRYIWNILGFDPIQSSLWTDLSITKDSKNKFLQFFINNPFDILNDVGTDLTAPNISGAYSVTYSTLVSTTYVNLFENNIAGDTENILKDEQASVIYDK